MAGQLKMLFEPIKVGSTTIRNRILLTGHENNYTRDGLISERHGYYYAERAKGGIGLVVTGIQSVHHTSGGGQLFTSWGYDKRSIPRYRMVADMVHEHGAKIFAQIWHCGFHNTTYVRGEWDEILAPSQVTCPRYRETARAVTTAEIREIIDGYVQTAVNAKEGGFDGVELHGAHSYLPGQFLSPLTNKRTDEYGGSLDNRLRFSFELVDGVRRAVGMDFVVGMRVSGDELHPGGLTRDDMVEAAQRLEAHGGLDYISVSVATYHTLHIMIGGNPLPLGTIVPLASAIRSGVKSTPVFTVLRINDPIQADKILVDGHADMVGMTRATICDPEMPNKAREGRFDEIRYCVGCNQGCIQHVGKGYPVTCIQHPATGNEKKLGIGTMKPAARKKKIVIVGGGPAGLKTAEIAAKRGHEVIVYERESEIGGQIRTASKAAGREEWGNIARNFANILRVLGVTIKLNAEATPQTIAQENPDAVVIATGSVERKTGFSPMLMALDKVPGVDQEKVVVVEDVLKGTVPVGKRVVILSDDGGHKGVSTAETLADQGKEVEIVSRFYHPAPDLDATHETPYIYPRLLAKGVKMTPSTWVKEITARDVVCFNLFSRSENVIKDVDTVVLATVDRQCRDELYAALQGRVKELYKIGDCAVPRKVANAIADGDRIGRLL